MPFLYTCGAWPVGLRRPPPPESLPWALFVSGFYAPSRRIFREARFSSVARGLVPRRRALPTLRRVRRPRSDAHSDSKLGRLSGDGLDHPGRPDADAEPDADALPDADADDSGRLEPRLVRRRH